MKKEEERGLDLRSINRKKDKRKKEKDERVPGGVKKKENRGKTGSLQSLSGLCRH